MCLSWLSAALQLRLPCHVLGIAAQGRCKQWQEALKTFDSLKKQRISANVYVYNATISACEKMLDFNFLELKTLPAVTETGFGGIYELVSQPRKLFEFAWFAAPF